ncbi:winged helix-turn-helix transcriptional regulator [Kerstersia gyiorum]|uniref:winged helix-turn-helix transcriptional regulator n=1 Tax=Kerstersia gyiorum TaxID=206506 RepID=UPI000A0380AD|nr:helix-turn-helix domain-containing protein [Kerstersia gyiorum]MCR4159705.1 helix-turn-helix transcriptional regulator [Kerstersia gyiorum]
MKLRNHAGSDGINGKHAGDSSFQPIPSNGICTRLGDKWTVQVIWRLAIAGDHRLRFSEIKREVEGITQRMLTLTLRNLERDGLVERHYFPEVPPRVEYEITELGQSMLRALEGINSWVRENLPRVEQLRQTYDAKQC